MPPFGEGLLGRDATAVLRSRGPQLHESDGVISGHGLFVDRANFQAVISGGLGDPGDRLHAPRPVRIARLGECLSRWTEEGDHSIDAMLVDLNMEILARSNRNSIISGFTPGKRLLERVSDLEPRGVGSAA
jgi:hypothetical protein